MTNIEFRNTLTAAVAGEHYALEMILEQYSPLIDRYSIIDGKLDEDLLFYMSSRGLKEEDIYDIISGARFRGLCRQIPDDDVKRDARKFFNGGIEIDE